MSSGIAWGVSEEQNHTVIETFRRRFEEIRWWDTHLQHERSELSKRKEAREAEQRGLEAECALYEEKLEHRRFAVRILVEKNNELRRSICSQTLQKSTVGGELEKAKNELNLMREEEERDHCEIAKRTTDLTARYESAPWMVDFNKHKEKREALMEQRNDAQNQVAVLAKELKELRKLEKLHDKYPFTVVCTTAARLAIKNRSLKTRMAKQLVELSNKQKLLTSLESSQSSQIFDQSAPPSYARTESSVAGGQQRSAQQTASAKSPRKEIEGTAKEITEYARQTLAESIGQKAAVETVSKASEGIAAKATKAVSGLSMAVKTAGRDAQTHKAALQQVDSARFNEVSDSATSEKTAAAAHSVRMSQPEQQRDEAMRYVVIDEEDRSVEVDSSIEVSSVPHDDVTGVAVGSAENSASRMDEVTANEEGGNGATLENTITESDDAHMFDHLWGGNDGEVLESPNNSTAHVQEDEVLAEIQNGAADATPFNLAADADANMQFSGLFENIGDPFQMNNFNLSSLNANSSQEFDAAALLNMSSAIAADDGASDYLSMFGGSDGNNEQSEPFEFHFGSDSGHADDSSQDTAGGAGGLPFSFF